jgi:hypothetical protein
VSERRNPGPVGVGGGKADRKVEAGEDGAAAGLIREPPQQRRDLPDRLRCGRSPGVSAAIGAGDPAALGLRAPVRVRDE